MPSNFTSKRNPAYVSLVDESAAALGTNANPLVTTSSGGGVQAIVGDKVTAAGAGDSLVSSTNTTLYSISTTDSVTIILKDGTDEVFSIVGPGQLSFYTPLGFTTSLTLNFSGAGSAYIQYQ